MSPLPCNHSLSARLTCSVAEGKYFLKNFLRAKCSTTWRKPEISGLWAPQPCPLVIPHCSVSSRPEPCPTGVRRGNGYSWAPLQYFVFPWLLASYLIPAKCWNAEDEVVNIILTPLCCLFQMYRCPPEAVMGLFSPDYGKISICLYISLSIYLLRWLQMGKSELESSTYWLQVWGQACPHRECVLCAVYLRHKLPWIQLWVYVH